MTQKIIHTLFFTLSLFSTVPAFAAGKATVTVNAKTTQDGRVELTFKTTPADGLAINKEGPWKLELKSSGKLKFEKKEYKRADWKEDFAGFSLTSEPTKEKSDNVKYKLVAFICTKDKSQCFREVIEGASAVKW